MSFLVSQESMAKQNSYVTSDSSAVSIRTVHIAAPVETRTTKVLIKEINTKNVYHLFPSKCFMKKEISKQIPFMKIA